MTKPAMTFGVAEEAAITSAGDNRVCSDGGCGKNECGGSEGTGAGYRGSSKMGFLCYRDGSGLELLHLQGIRAHGPTLQKPGNKGKSSGQ